jgi:hypothetical protein
MALLAVAMELGAGLALHDAWRMLGEGGADWDALRERLAEVRARMVSNTFEITALQNEPAIYAARFWRNFYRAMLTHTMRNAMTKLLIVLAAVLPFARVRAATDVRRTVVIAIDLTASVGTRGPDRTTEFQKNIDGVTRFLGEAPAGSRVVVFSITDRSFAHPYILLSATIPEDEGYFGERLQSARTELVRVWRSRTRDLKPRYQKTDILGALLIASQVFSQTSPRAEKLLLIFSDMRQNTSELDLESLRLVPPFEKLSKEAKMIPQAQLHNVDVSILGVDGAGKSVAYWQSLEGFWSEYFQRNGARLLSYSALRELPR